MTGAMKRVLLIIATTLIASAGFSQNVTINFKDGNQVTYSLGNVESIVFGDSDNNGGEDNDDYSQSLQITLNGESHDVGWKCFWLYPEPIMRNGKEVYLYGKSANTIMITSQDAMHIEFLSGYFDANNTPVPKPEGAYTVVNEATTSGRYIDYDENVGLTISGGNMKYRTVTSGALHITKVKKRSIPASGEWIGRNFCYELDGDFSFVLRDNRNGQETNISGTYRIIM
jgi:hypothetical protein